MRPRAVFRRSPLLVPALSAGRRAGAEVRAPAAITWSTCAALGATYCQLRLHLCSTAAQQVDCMRAVTWGQPQRAVRCSGSSALAMVVVIVLSVASEWRPSPCKMHPWYYLQTATTAWLPVRWQWHVYYTVLEYGFTVLLLRMHAWLSATIPSTACALSHVARQSLFQYSVDCRSLHKMPSEPV